MASEFSRLYLDTNIFIFMTETTGTVPALLLELVALENRSAKPIFVTSELTLSELLVKPVQTENKQLMEQYDRQIRSSDWLDVCDVHRQILFHAAHIRVQVGLKLPDAIHVATAFVTECSHFLSADTGIREHSRSNEILDITLPLPPLKILRPDEPTLTSILESFNR